MIRVILTDEARAEALKAFAFYEERREGLGERFRDHLGLAISRIQANPELYPVVYRDLRRRLVERFPYALFYRISPGLIAIVAVVHAKQNPMTWKRRASHDEPG